MHRFSELAYIDAGSEPIDPDLAAIAALATTTFGRALLTVADAAAARSALELGTAATTDSSAYAPVGAHLSKILGKIAAGSNPKVVGLGDSIMAGTGASAAGTTDWFSLLCTAINSRYGVTVTKSNRAVAGRTIQQAMLQGDFASALSDAGDLYLISYAHNDSKSDPLTTVPGFGYPSALFLAAVEHMVRRIRLTVPAADIILVAENPSGTSFTNANNAVNGLNKQMELIARAYGCGWVDVYSVFTALGSWDTYLADGTHPNDAGHALTEAAVFGIFPASASTAVVAQQPAVPDTSITNQHRYDRAGWANTANKVAALSAGVDGYVLTGTWSGASAPYTSSTAGDTAEYVFLGTECLLNNLTGGVVHIDIDNQRVYTSLDLTSYAGTRGVPMSAAELGMGIHHVRVTIVSGTVTVGGMDVLHAPCEWISVASGGGITFTGTWTYGSAITGPWTTERQQSSTATDTFSFDFVGTGFAIEGRSYAGTGHTVTWTPTVDGVAQTAVVIPAGQVDGAFVGVTMVTGLPYGRHTVSVQATTRGSSTTYTVDGVFTFDERRIARPRRARGVCTVGKAVKYPCSYGGRPVVTTNNITTDSGVVRPTSGAATGFTPSGTASEQAIWTAEGDRVAW